MTAAIDLIPRRDKSREVIKVCPCCKREYTRAGWLKLRYAYTDCALGYGEEMAGEPDHEFRQCVCKSTIAIAVPCFHLLERGDNNAL